SGFASTFTLVASLLSGVVAAGVIPDHTSWLSKEIYVVLNLIFVALVACAGLVFGSFQDEIEDKPHGRVGPFIAAAIITSWAAFGELITLWLLVWDVNGTSGLTPGGVKVIDGVLCASAALMLIYFYSRVIKVTARPTPKN